MPLLAFDSFDLGIGDEFDVKMPADLDQLGRNNSHGALVCGKGLIQLRHHSAHSRGFFDQVNIKASVGKIQGRLNACYTAAGNQDRTDRAVIGRFACHTFS
jgi:hypothetical protein